MYQFSTTPDENEAVFAELEFFSGPPREAPFLLCLGENDDGAVCIDPKDWPKMLQTATAAM